ncbi:hypothetical protein [Paenibacillus sp. FSL L8-0506]|uniref:hypothetical protein n=1 Tax=Paenibacillus sp. FSL L8-0506 TaxID=2975335 RepID=UPI0030F5D361
MKQAYDKESVYDEKIAPLMKLIIEVCKEEEIPMVSSFYIQSADISRLEGEIVVSTIIPVKDNTPGAFKEIERILYPRTYAMAVTITSEKS